LLKILFRNFLTVLLFLFFVGCQNTPTTPQWFENRNLAIKEHQIVGYGVGNSQEEAKSKSLQDIASQIKVKVSSDFNKEASISKDGLDSQMSYKSSQSIEEDLEFVKVFKSEKIGEKFFVASKYSLLSRVDRFVSEINSLNCSAFKNSFLKQTSVAQKILESKKCEVNFSLTKDIQNKVALKSENKIISLGSNEIKELFFNSKSSDFYISLNPDKQSFKNEEEFLISVKPDKKGFLSLFVIDEQGKIFTLINNLLVKKTSMITYPPNGLFKYYSYIPKDVKKDSIQDLYIAVVSEEKLNKSFKNIGSETDNSQVEAEFIDFIQIFDEANVLQKNISFTSQILKTYR